MNQRIAKGFTLVEILIVVVILGILAAIVVPQFTNASQDAIKGALASQLQTVNSQVELFRVQNAGTLPTIAPTESDGGWGIMITGDFLKDEPNNGYTRTSTVGNAVVTVAAGASPAAGAVGWAFSTTTGEVLATGYDNDNNLLSNEGGLYTNPAF